MNNRIAADSTNEFSEYSRDLWDYLGDMPYMPSRQDRDQLLELDEKRVRIWDYFFRINPTDVGLPIKERIRETEANIANLLQENERNVSDVRRKQSAALNDMERKRDQAKIELDKAKVKLKETNARTLSETRSRHNLSLVALEDKKKKLLRLEYDKYVERIKAKIASDSATDRRIVDQYETEIHSLTNEVAYLLQQIEKNKTDGLDLTTKKGWQSLAGCIVIMLVLFTVQHIFAIIIGLCLGLGACYIVYISINTRLAVGVRKARISAIHASVGPYNTRLALVAKELGSIPNSTTEADYKRLEARQIEKIEKDAADESDKEIANLNALITSLEQKLADDLARLDGEFPAITSDIQREYEEYRQRLEQDVSKLTSQKDIKLNELNTKIATLKQRIEDLIQKIPPPPEDSLVEAWFNEDINNLRENSIIETAVISRLLPIKTELESGEYLEYNPFTIIGPGELQGQQEIPIMYRGQQSSRTQTEKDRYRHLYQAKRQIFNEETGTNVLYGVYYIEFILLAQDMMATMSFFYDFIRGQAVTEATSEVYYRDIVTIATTSEIRELPKYEKPNETILIEGVPTFSISLTSGEKRQVTLPNRQYLRETLRINVDESGKSLPPIDSIALETLSSKHAKNAIKAVRKYVRDHHENKRH